MGLLLSTFACTILSQSSCTASYRVFCQTPTLATSQIGTDISLSTFLLLTCPSRVLLNFCETKNLLPWLLTARFQHPRILWSMQFASKRIFARCSSSTLFVSRNWSVGHLFLTRESSATEKRLTTVMTPNYYVII